ncbi:hypothetical protein OAC22_01215 [bacterium]|nr:hypothetical protein [bacterium]
MKQRIYRYIAIAFGILAVLSTIGELRLGQIPIVALFLLAGAKQFYDNSVGKVSGGSCDQGAGFAHISSAPTPWEPDGGYNSWNNSLSRGEYPGGGKTNPFD